MTQNHQSSCHLNETELNIRNIGDRSTICTNRLRTSVEHHQTENKKQHHQTEHQTENQDSIPQHIYKDMYTCVYIYVRIARRRAIYHIHMEETTAKWPAHTCAREFQNQSQTTNRTQKREQKTTPKPSPKNEPQSETSSRPRSRGPEHGLPNAVPKTVAIFWPQILANRGEARQLGLTPSCQNWWPENGPQKIAIFRPTPENRRQERDRQHAMTQRRKSKATNNRWTQG